MKKDILWGLFLAAFVVIGTWVKIQLDEDAQKARANYRAMPLPRARVVGN
jgi:hypothetical protein